ncbi:hypothetical protein IJD44_00870 [bacterium]|nr:hypothetical protein [bacterium]
MEQVKMCLRKFYGLAPYDGDTNFVKGDSFYLDTIYDKFGVELTQCAMGELKGELK